VWRRRSGLPGPSIPESPPEAAHPRFRNWLRYGAGHIAGTLGPGTLFVLARPA
jgi:hypothetical protein